MIAAGLLRERFTFQQRAPKALPGDKHGTPVDDWVDVLTAAARLLPLRRGEAVIAARLEGVQPCILTIRSHTQARLIATDWRCVDARKGTVYNIRTVEHAPDRSTIDLLIEAGGASG